VVSQKKQPTFSYTFGVIRHHWLGLLIIGLAVWLRVWQLPDLGILFGDAGHDLLVASESLNAKKLPLLGIASSMPQFKQGPLSIWLSMSVIGVFGHQPWAIFMIYALLGVSAVVGLYWLISREVDRKTATIASAWLAVSPLAVAHSRMPYHITPLPLLIVIWLWATTQWWRNKLNIFWVTLSWASVFQCELATAPLLAVIVYSWWRTKKKINKHQLAVAGAGLGVGLLPQIIYDLTHRGEQLVTFGAWVGYRVLSFVVPTTDHGFAQVDRWSQLASAFQRYGTRMVSVDNGWLAIGVWFISLIVVIYAVYQVWRQSHHLPILIEVTSVATVILLLGFMVHGAPSEAYFPPLFILIPILLGWAASQLSRPLLLLIGVAITVWTLLNVQAIIKAHWFVSTDSSFSYGPSVAEQQKMLEFLEKQNPPSIGLRTTQPGGEFANYFDNLKWLAQDKNIEFKSEASTLVFIESKDSPLKTYPGVGSWQFESVTLYALN
jgi:4-amino-4-deoxy-L-arabinose transferase-like glycosyltransferase